MHICTKLTKISRFGLKYIFLVVLFAADRSPNKSLELKLAISWTTTDTDAPTSQLKTAIATNNTLTELNFSFLSFNRTLAFLKHFFDRIVLYNSFHSIANAMRIIFNSFLDLSLVEYNYSSSFWILPLHIRCNGNAHFRWINNYADVLGEYKANFGSFFG